jgi:hypothetical protein
MRGNKKCNRNICGKPRPKSVLMSQLILQKSDPVASLHVHGNEPLNLLTPFNLASAFVTINVLSYLFMN